MSSEQELKGRQMNNKKNGDTNTILLCLDLEEGSRELAEYCNQCAQDWDYVVEVIHIHSDEGQETNDAESYLKALVNETLNNVKVSTVKVVVGSPEEHIIDFANKLSNTPVIMLGKRKRRIADRMYVGSTTSAVITLSNYPVLVVPLKTFK